MSQSNFDSIRRAILEKKYIPLNRKGKLFQEMLREGWELKAIDRSLCVMTRVHAGFHYTRTIVGSPLFPKIESKFYKIVK